MQQSEPQRTGAQVKQNKLKIRQGSIKETVVTERMTKEKKHTKDINRKHVHLRCLEYIYI